MGVFIRGMKMPPDCADCPFDWRECEWLRGNSVFSFVKRPDDCPLVEVKEFHGDLVEREEAIKAARRADDDRVSLSDSHIMSDAFEKEI